jgi:hypothetical protein
MQWILNYGVIEKRDDTLKVKKAPAAEQLGLFRFSTDGNCFLPNRTHEAS